MKTVEVTVEGTVEIILRLELDDEVSDDDARDWAEHLFEQDIIFEAGMHVEVLDFSTTEVEATEVVHDEE